ncbi:MAG: class I SAM-dependent methyltransferase [Jiangellaceae bacterium]
MSEQPDLDWAEHADHLTQSARTDAGWYRAVAADLIRPGDRLLVDVGCGGAGMAAALAGAAPTAQVVAVDGEAAVLAGARQHLEDAGVGDRVRLVQADLAADQAELAGVIGGPADLVWASAVVHHAPDQQAVVDALASLLGPSGRLALAEGGLTPRYLPWDLGVGEPGLELRLAAAQDRWFAAMRTGLPATVRMPYGWGRVLANAGLADLGTRTILLERPAPLDPGDRHLVASKLAHRLDWLHETDYVSAGDLRAWDLLLDSDGPHWVGNRDDVFMLDARSVHVGTRPTHE